MASSEALTAQLEAVTAALAAGAPPPGGSTAALAATTDVLALGALADDVRRARHGGTATFVRVHDVAVDDAASGGPVPEAAAEVRISGRPATLGAAVEAVRQARTLAGDRPVRGFWLAELAGFGSGAFAAVAAAGLDGIAFVATGVGAAEAIGAARAAGLTVDVIALEQAPADRVAWLVEARRLADAVGAITAVAPLPRQLDRAMPTTGFDDVRTVALARLLIGAVPTVQVDWPRYGPKLAQVALAVGADDLDGVSPVDDPALGARRAAAEDVRRNIAAAGLSAVERDGRWAVRGR
jgi:aminodeoxyfutalosine synthase